MKAGIYARVSTNEQETENQVMVLTEWARQRGFEVVEIYQEAESAWRSGHQRELKRLMEDALCRDTGRPGRPAANREGARSETGSEAVGVTMQRYEWQWVRIEYVQGRENGDGTLEWPTLEQLAQEYGMAPNTIRSRAAREHWTELRNDFATILQQKTREKTLEQLAEKASQLDLQAFSVARAMLILADRERLLRMGDTAHRLGRRALGQEEA